jgi:hypothetical protein
VNRGHAVISGGQECPVGRVGVLLAF